MHINKTSSKIMAMVLSVTMIFTAIPMTAFAEIDVPPGVSGEITEFAVLDTEVAAKSVSLGTPPDALNLPETLTATVALSADDNTDETGGSTFATMNIPVPVTWTVAPDYDGDTSGTYIFTADITAIDGGFTISATAVLPKITVTVTSTAQNDGAEPQTKAGKTITEFAKLGDSTRHQEVFGALEPKLPEKLTVIVDGAETEIAVTWKDENNFADTKPAEGLYIFTAEMPEGYALANGISAPVIGVMRRGMGRALGAGTMANPLQITTAAQLVEISALVYGGILESAVHGGSSTNKVYLKLMNDIDISAYGASYNAGGGWVPIGRYDGTTTIEYYFNGEFDGNGKVITGLYINDTTLDDVGLFGVVGGTVKNLGVKGVKITGRNNVGGVAGLIYGGSVTNCYSTGTVSGTNNVGGVAGNAAGGRVTKCYSNAAVSGVNMVGGVVGVAGDSGVTNCYSTGAVYGISNIGGVVGCVSDSSVTNCYSTSAVSGTEKVGGVAGQVYGGVENCAALNPSVRAGVSKVGRVVGEKDGFSTLAGNVAFSGMTDSSGTGGAAFSGTNALDGLGGLDISAANATGDIGGRFTTANGWTTANGKLPGLNGKAVEPPAHLINTAGSLFDGGNGNMGTPYEISTAEQLATLAALVNDGNTNYNDKYYELTNNINLFEYGKNWNDGKGWIPIGHGTVSTNYFYGYFDGNGKTVSGLYINNTDLGSAGLFGIVSGGEVKNLGVVGANVIGGSITGGVAGAVDNSSVTNCYVTGTVFGNDFVGGVAGFIDSNGSVTYCYATSAVGGFNEVGGVAGYVNNTSEVKNCAALNSSVKGSGTNVGRVAGITANGGALADNVAFDGMFDISGGTTWGNIGATGLGGESKTAGDIKGDGTLFNNFIDNNDPWTTATGKLPGFGGTVAMPVHIESGLYFAGTGASNDPFLIYTAAELEMLATFVNEGISPYADANKYYYLMADIDLSAYGADYVATNGSIGWVPIGHDNTKKFLGNFDGGNNIISGLYIDNANGGYDNVGLFGNVDGDYINNLGITGVNITNRNAASSLTGGLAGQFSTGSINNCYITGNITGLDNTGGLVGDFEGTLINSCVSTAMVSGDTNTGGLVGNLEGGSVLNSYATGDVLGFNNVGGLVGGTGNTLRSGVVYCYATGAVNGNATVGGVIGNVSAQATVENCAALNPLVFAHDLNSDAGRVAGNLTQGGTLTNNRAYNFMAVDGVAFSGASNATGTNGADMTIANAITPVFWTGTMRWASPWTFAPDKLPVINAAAQNGDPGIYLTQLPLSPVTPPVNPPGGGGSGEVACSSKTADVKFNGQTVKLKLNADGTLTLNCTEADVKKYADNTGGLDIAVSGADSITLSINIPALGTDDLTLQTSFGAITIPNDTLQTLQELYGDTLRLVITKGSFKVALIDANMKEVAYNDPANPFIITLPHTLQSGQSPGAVVAVNKNGVIFPFGVYRDGSVTFEITATGTYTLKYNAKTFSDITGHWAIDYIDFVAARGLFNGDNGQFMPGGSMTRAMFAQVLANLEDVDLSVYKTSRFSDVAVGQWYAAAVEWAADKGIVSGYGVNFDPNASITREQMAVMLYNYMKYKGYTIPSGTASAFADESSISSWAYEAVKAIQKMGIVSGKQGNLFDPQGMATRAEVATIFARFVEHVAGMTRAGNKTTASDSTDLNTALAMLPGKRMN